MVFDISNRTRAVWVGVLIIVAYSMLTYSFTGNKILGLITDVLSGLAVIGIPILMFPIFNSDENKRLNFAYLTSRLIEGVLMIVGGVLILVPSLEGYRNSIYESVHVYFFMAGALFFYILLYRAQVVPKFISIWGILATIALFAVTMINLFGADLAVLNVLILPIVLNEVFLAGWLIGKGFNART
ncbi:MAG: DUF4386 family protein [Rhodobacteraceae bacterium]|nr:DUF4386 family protein [Paracoccaceae bacterium]